MRTLMYTVGIVSGIFVFGACQPKVDTNAASDATSAGTFLYVASGGCYSGNGVTTFSTTTSSNIIYKVNLSTGVRDSIIADYNSSPATPGDSPISIVDWDAQTLAVLVRNGTAGRLELLPKSGGSRGVFGTNPATSTILSTAPQNMAKSTDGGLLMIRTGFIEKINSTGVRLATPYVNSNLGATCGAANTLLTNIAVSPTGKIITASANATPKLIVVPAAGASGSCLSGTAPVGASYATAMAYDTTNSKIIVAWAGSTTASDVNSIVVYDYNDTTGAVSNPKKIYDASLYPTTYNYLLFGISAMTYNDATKSLYVATAISSTTTVASYQIEKFSYDATELGVDNTKVLTRSGSIPFYSYGLDTKCISAMLVATETASASSGN